MKKLLTTTMLIALFAITGFSQSELVSKKGVPILPEKGEYSISIDATPFLEYFGNLANGNVDNNTPFWNYSSSSPLYISCKRMVDDKTAYRAMFRFGVNSFKDVNFMQLDEQSDPLLTVEDTRKISSMNIGLGAGLEKRRGKGRVQGIYGAMAMLTIATAKDTYEYGNAYSETNLNPARTPWAANPTGYGWVIEDKAGSTFGIHVQGFVGVEYFFAPKMSLSGEFRYGLGYTNEGDGDLTVQSWDFANNAVKTTTTTTGGHSFFGLDTSLGGFLNLNFYF